MESLNIAQISPAVYSLPPAGYAGIEKIVTSLTKELIKMGHNVTVFAPSGSDIPGANIVQTVAPSINNDEAGAFRVYEDMLTSDFDIIHDHTHLKYVYMHKNANKLPICSTLHNQLNFATHAPVKHMNLIGISAWQSMDASAKLGIPVPYVYNGVDTDEYEFKVDKTDRLLFLSRISRFKGAHEAIALAKRLRIPMDVAGDDVFVNDPPYVHSIMSSCIGDITYRGGVQPTIKRSLLSNARALILPLLWDEPFGMVVIEALASGTPVITMRRGAMPELIEHGQSGFLCDTIPQMEEIIRNGSLDEIVPLRCAQRAEMFSSENMAKKYIEKYKQIMEGNVW